MTDEDKKEEGTKRKLDELNETDGQTSTETNNENPVKKVKSSDNGQASSSNDANALDDSRPPAPTSSTLSSDEEQVNSSEENTSDNSILSASTSSVSSLVEQSSDNDQVTTLIAGGLYWVQSPELGDFPIRAGATGRFCVKAYGLKILDSQGTLVFPLPNITLPAGAEVEIKDNLNGATTLTLISGSPPVENEAPIQVAGVLNNYIIIHGARSAVVTGNGGWLRFSGTGTVTVQGSLQSVQNNGTGNVNVNGRVTAGIRQTATGNIVINGGVRGTIYNSGGGSIQIHCGNIGSRQITNTNGRVSIHNVGRATLSVTSRGHSSWSF